MENWPVYLLMVSYNREDCALAVIDDYYRARKPNIQTTFLIIENSDDPRLFDQLDFSKHDSLKYYYYPNKNKAAVVNYALKNLIEENEALIIHVDNDISFQKDYILKFYNAAREMGSEFYFGNSFFVNFPKSFNSKFFPYLQGSARGKSDEEFKKMSTQMFLGFSYAFFKSQWQIAHGLDERFSPGSVHNLAAEESIFQFRLMHVGFRPFFISNNPVEHKPQHENFLVQNIRARQENNGYTHGFRHLVQEKGFITYFKILLILIKKLCFLIPKNDSLDIQMRISFLKGFFKAFLLYLTIKNKKNFLDF